ncbi:hypothetical protein GMA19_02121 [Paenibacillus polymyxa E681]|nr:hypothetical protein PPE_05700 [Paenibacillus polymyxa E681]QNV56957.1 hypothetical protein GE561_02121 [Paenibacillus polymyxa E681]QNV61794.1 hypothetical protein GMA19_02121 [Paenibacillus polymyxa E681]
MNKSDWTIAASIIFVGLSCMIMSATAYSPNPMLSYFGIMLKLAVVAGILTSLFWLTYLWLNKRKK